ncbi:MAG TPA: N-acetylmuramic acid 6-phosphate etherase [Haloplasmataceae bacterium]
MVDLHHLATEQVNLKTIELDNMPIREALIIMNEEDQKVAQAIKPAIPQIEKAIHAVIDALNNGGRLIYIGAGTSGRLGVLDAVECPPTFGTKPEQVIGLIAGGPDAFAKAVEGAEDSETSAQQDLESIQLNRRDVVVGITASGRTPYVLHGIRYAKTIGCQTIGIACNRPSELGELVDIAIEVVVGPEVLTGSTRLKAGTAQKMILNMISTLSMVGIGKVYKNLMVDVQLTNQKLQSRAIHIIMNATGATWEQARKALEDADGAVKVAITMILLKCDAKKAQERLREAKGFIRKAIDYRS